MIEKGDRLVPKDKFRNNYNIPLSTKYVTVETISYGSNFNLIHIVWGDNNEYSYQGVFYLDDFEIIESLNNDIRKILNNFDIVDVSFTTRDGKILNLYLEKYL